MSDSNPFNHSQDSPAQGRRRAPTITIDTSAVRRPSIRPDIALDTLSDNSFAVQGNDQSPSGLHPYQTSPTDLRPSSSFDNENSRPTSPHNVSSPTFNNPQNFLSVPPARSRAGSFDTLGAESSSTGTYVNSSPEHGMPKAFGPQDSHGGPEVLSASEALHPDPGTEDDFKRENNPFAFTPGQMGKMFNPKSLGAFHALGGISGIEKGLRSDRKSGLSLEEQHLDGQVSFEEATDHENPNAQYVSNGGNSTESDSGSFSDRVRIFGDNRLPEKKAKPLWRLAWEAYNDKILLLLTGAAVISLALGLYQTFGTPAKPGEPHVEWVEGVAIVVAIVIVVGVGALNDWQKERQFVKLNKKKDNREVKVIRSGKTMELSVHDVLAGDILLLEPGDMVPVDGVLIEGHGIKCDESSATGESDIIKKTASEEVWRAMEAHEPLKKMDPFILSGAKVTEGVGKFLVVATGVNSSYGKTMMSLREDSEVTPLQSKLNTLAEYIAKLGGAAALLLFIVLFIKFCAKLPGDHRSPSDKAQNFLNILIVAVTIVVVAVPEGLPLAVTLALAFATKRMTKDNNLVRVLRSCETMGNATTVCSDKTGTLTQNVMTVVAGTFGTTSRFSSKASKDQDAQGVNVDSVDTSEFVGTLGDNVKTLMKDSIALNSTAFEGEENGKTTFIGSKTETALLAFARDFLGMEAISTERSNAELVQFMPFDSGRKCMGVVQKIGNKYRLYVKGASEIMLRHATMIIRDPSKGIDGVSISNDNIATLNKLIETYASNSLRTIGFLYRDFEQWPPKNARRSEDDKTQAIFEDVLKDMTFLGVIGIQDPLRDGVTDAVMDCLTAGVFPRMVTGDNIMTAKAIASECGIFTPGGVALEGPVFRKMSKQEQLAVIPKLQVLARSSPDDKRVLVKRLKEMGETVAVTGDGTNDAPALKAADVGFSMGIAGTEVAKEASDIILMDDNFASIIKALMWGRAVNDAVQKFLQFQITVNITAVLLAFVSAVASNDESSVLTAVQLLWVNLIMDTFAALALATDPPTRTIIDRKPAPKSAPLITVNMWKMIIGQAIYQLIITYVLYFGQKRGGNSLLSYANDKERERLNAMVFNCFVWMQVFNMFNNRRLDNKFNIFEGVQRNVFFIGIALIMIGGQVMIMFVGGRAFSVERLTGEQWGYSVGLGAISIPIGVIIRLIPDELITRLIPAWLKRKAAPKLVVEDEERPFEYSQALLDIRDELAFIKRIKGGRLNQIKFTLKHPREALLHSRSASRSRSSMSLPQTPNGEHSEGEAQSLAPPTPDSRRRSRGRSRSNSAFAGAAMAGIVAGSIGAAWSPIERGHGDADSMKFSRARSRSDLSRESGLEIHPETKSQDPVVVQQQIDGHHPPSQSNDTTPAFGSGPFAGHPNFKLDDGTKQ
ncbi:calcium-translocating P-type ATPase [Aureobasidium sp. EXF-3400]|nr:calcium-translocating P-type ATPase [Aureobasidium sp. EXF-12344]KAI4774263.1 calcium-translocating P-type ATPase [Aureobasidium sp. EXF-3400]